MKYIDVEKLKAEIGIIRQMLENRDVHFNEVKKIRTETMVEFCKCLLNFIDSLQQEQTSLPDNLDEAAEKFARLYDNGTCDGIAQDCFNAGAEWQKEQMMRRAANAEITKRLDGTLGVCAYLDKGSGFKFGDKVKLIIAKEESK